jgi:hypothetical protein
LTGAFAKGSAPNGKDGQAGTEFAADAEIQLSAVAAEKGQLL